MYYPLHQNHSQWLIQGKNAGTFLQGQLTCDVDKSEANQALLGALCTKQGRILSHLWLWRSDLGFHLLLPTALTTICENALKTAAMLSRISIETLNTPLWGHIGLHQVVDVALAKPFSDMGWRQEAPIDQQADTTLPWKQALQQRGLVTICEQTTDAFTPHMLHYPTIHAVSFDKGCYLGQEIIARTQYLGKTKRTAHLATLRIAEEKPVIGSMLLDSDGQPIGRIADAIAHEEGYRLWLIASAQIPGSQIMTALGTIQWQPNPWDAAGETLEHRE